MKLLRRRFLQLAATAAVVPAVLEAASAQDYPTRPVRLVVGFPAGGPNDILGRLMAQWLSERLGQPVEVENWPGASGNIGTEAVVRAPPDGYTLLLVGPANAISGSLNANLSFNFLRDIAPVAGITREPLVMVTHPSVPARTAPEFIAQARAAPGGRTGAGNVRADVGRDRADQVGQAARPGGDDRGSLGGAARRSAAGRRRAGLRGERGHRHWRSQRHACPSRRCPQRE